MSDLETFRAETRQWLEANCPPSMRRDIGDENEAIWGGRNFVFKNPEAKLWLERMGAKGWTAPTWPKEYGGGGLSRDEAKILEREMARIKARPDAAFVRHLDAGAGAAGICQRRTETRTSAENRARRNPLVPGLFRAGRGIGSGQPCARAARTRAIISSSTARKSGRPMPIRPTGFSASCAPTRRRSTKAFRSSCST